MLPACSLPSILGTTIREKLGKCQDPAGPTQAGIPARICPHFSTSHTLPFQHIINTDGNSVQTRFPILLPTVARAAPQHRCDIQHSQPPRLQHLGHTLLRLRVPPPPPGSPPSLHPAPPGKAKCLTGLREPWPHFSLQHPSHRASFQSSFCASISPDQAKLIQGRYHLLCASTFLEQRHDRRDRG